MYIALLSCLCIVAYAKRSSLSIKLNAFVDSVAAFILRKSLYAGYKTPPPPIGKERVELLTKEKKGFLIPCQNSDKKPIELFYIPSPSKERTGNAVILALNTSFQNQRAKHFDFYLENGADVVLWNPTALSGQTYAHDLGCVIETLKKRTPTQKIAIKSYCASVEPAIAAVATRDDPSISLIVDRGYGDIFKLARAHTVVSLLPCVQRVLKESFSCDGIGKIASIQGEVLFLAPEKGHDQVMKYGKGNNLTYDLFEARRAKIPKQQEPILLPNSDHWTKWSAATHNKVNGFLERIGILHPKPAEATAPRFPTPTAPSWAKLHCFPLATKSWY
jgi:hypothetical protein